MKKIETNFKSLFNLRLNTLIGNFTGHSVFICQRLYDLTFTGERDLDRAIGSNLILPIGFKERYRI